ncbi:MAG: hypothetical protein MUF34_18855 [Polyangiaceae bacterium]|nr:hypothetical protein [Polyangiaceae bacterium]
MSNERIGRINRIVDLRQRTLNEARSGLADAARKAGEAGQARAAAEAAARQQRESLSGHVELRKVERWHEIMTEGEAVTARKVERVINDEFASRRAPR